MICDLTIIMAACCFEFQQKAGKEPGFTPCPPFGTEMHEAFGAGYTAADILMAFAGRFSEARQLAHHNTPISPKKQ